MNPLLKHLSNLSSILKQSQLIIFYCFIFDCRLLGKEAIRPDIKLVKKFSNDLWRECSIEHMFFSSSLIISITDRFHRSILSFVSICTFFKLFLNWIIKYNPLTNSISVSFFEIYPLSAYSLPLTFSINALSINGSLSSIFPGVITNLEFHLYH
jgi:hypothetical protein